MADLLNHTHYYHVYVDGEHKGKAIGGVPLTTIAEALPHGSGLDSDWHITLRRDGGISLRTEWHAMNEWGSYCGYWPVQITVDRTLRITGLRINKRYTNDVGDYLWELVQYALDEYRKSKAEAQSKEGEVTA